MPCTPAAKPALRQVSPPPLSGWVIVIFRFLAVVRVGHIYSAAAVVRVGQSLSCRQGGS